MKPGTVMQIIRSREGASLPAGVRKNSLAARKYRAKSWGTVGSLLLIHQGINRAARNALLTQVYSNLNQRIQNLRFRSNFDQAKWDKAAREHAAMVDALETRDGARLAAILRHHLHEKGLAVLDGRRAGREAAAQGEARA